MVARLNAQGIDAPFPIQQATIPDALAGRDICGKAPTGSGKTLAFGLAVMSRSTKSAPRRPQALILVPTRELASQVRTELSKLTDDRGKRIIAIYGGTGYGPTRQAINRGVDVVVACPGRLEDLIEQGTLELRDVHTVVIDEADRMADMGFLPAVRRILDLTRSDRQVMLFSATLGAPIEALVRQYQTDPARHDVVGEEADQGDVTHLFWHTPREDRVRVTAELVGTHGQAIVFCRTRRGADRVARQLKGEGVEAVAIHGDRTQAQRERALATFSRGHALALVATDVAARGIHVDNLPCVVHYDPPGDPTDYLHRSGRTGRAGHDGTVVSLVTDDQRTPVKALQRSLGFSPGLEAPGTPAATGEARIKPRVVANEPAQSEPSKANGSRSSHQRDASMPGRRARGPILDRSHTGSRGPSARNQRAGAPRGRTNAIAARRPNPSKPQQWTISSQDKQSNERKRGTSMPIGTVKFFNAEKGYGFVSQPDGEDVFVHYSNVQGSGFRTLEAGQQVEFEIAPGRKGDEARNVRVI
jgi:superfamily II DNA/RNA helicase